MSTKLFGQKLKMTQVFKDGRSYGVTPVEVRPDFDLSGLEPGIDVQVCGTSKGHGFQGVVKRHNFGGGPASHGQKHSHRAPGSIGSTAPAHVHPGKKMAGRMGMDRVTIKNIPLIEVDVEKNIVMLNGSVPGTIGRLVELVVPVELSAVAQTQEEEKVDSSARPQNDGEKVAQNDNDNPQKDEEIASEPEAPRNDSEGEVSGTPEREVDSSAMPQNDGEKAIQNDNDNPQNDGEIASEPEAPRNDNKEEEKEA